MACNPIQTRRKQLNLTREQLGQAVGVSGRTVSYWETWKKIPDPSRVGALQKVLNLSEIDLWRATHRASVKVDITRKRGSIW